MSEIGFLVEQILSKLNEQSMLFVAIDGRGGSGKTTLAEKLKEKLPNSKIVHLDDFNYPMTAKDYSRLIGQVLVPLKSTGKAKYQIYDYKRKDFGLWDMIENVSVLMIEGVTALHPKLYSYFDYSIWIECPREIGFKRGVVRELMLTGKDTTENWLKFLPLEDRYIAKYEPYKKANNIINGTKAFL